MQWSLLLDMLRSCDILARLGALLQWELTWWCSQDLSNNRTDPEQIEDSHFSILFSSLVSSHKRCLQPLINLVIHTRLLLPFSPQINAPRISNALKCKELRNAAWNCC